MDIREIALNILSKPPQPPQSIQLHLPSADEVANPTNEIFNMMLEFFNSVMVKLHGKNGKVDLNHVSEDDFLKVRQYFWSIGFEVFYKIYDNENNLLTNNRAYKKTTELFMKYITLQTETLRYEISFDYYKA